MKRIMVVLAVVVLALFALTACGGPGDADERFVGTWGFELSPDWTYEFRADGTGDRSSLTTLDGPRDSFTWGVDGDTFNIHLDENPGTVDGVRVRQNEPYAFTYSEGLLTLSLDGESWTYIRQTP